jgi:putative transposase
MINREHPLPLTKQCRILNLSRSGVYYASVLVSDRDRDLMNLIERIHMEEPYLGTRGIRNELWNRGHKVGRSHVRTLMRKTGIEALYQKPCLSKPSPGHTIYPYLLKGAMITEATKAWASDIT